MFVDGVRHGLESSRGELQDCFRPHSIGGLNKKLWMPKVPGVQTRTILGLHFGSPEKKCHLDVASAESYREYYIGEGGGFPQIRAVVNQVSPSCPWLVPTPRVFPNVN